MGKKSRLKKEKKEQGVEGILDRHPMRKEILTFFEKRRVAIHEAAGLLHVASLMAIFLIRLSFMKYARLPIINPEEDKADKDRFQKLGVALEHACGQLGIEVKDVLDDLVLPMGKNEMIMEPILQRIHQTLDSLIASKDFREATESQMDNAELWGDNLTHYEKQKEPYFQAVKELFALLLAVSRASMEKKPQAIEHEDRIEEIRKTYGIERDEFLKLRRRAQEFFRIAFAKHLSIVFQPVRDEVENIFSPPFPKSSA